VTATFQPIVARFPSSCCVCRAKIAAGQPIGYDRQGAKSQKVVCGPCLQKGALPQQASAPTSKPDPIQAAIQAAASQAAASLAAQQQPAAAALPTPPTPPVSQGSQGPVSITLNATGWPTVPGVRVHECEGAGQKFAHIDCDNIESLSVYAHQTPTAYKNINRWRHTKGNDDGPEWFGLPLAECVAVLAKGLWPDGAGKLRAALGDIGNDLPAPQSILRKPVRDSHGDTLDVQRVFRGDLERAWERRKRTRAVSRRHVTLYVNIAQAANRSAEELFWRGGCAAIAANLLEQAGYSVELVQTICSDNVWPEKNVSCLLTTIAKRVDEPVNLERLAATLALAGSFRYLGFLARCQGPWAVNFGYGNTRSRSADLLGDIDPGSIVIETGDVTNLAQARATLLKILAPYMAPERIAA